MIGRTCWVFVSILTISNCGKTNWFWGSKPNNLKNTTGWQLRGTRFWRCWRKISSFITFCSLREHSLYFRVHFWWLSFKITRWFIRCLFLIFFSDWVFILCSSFNFRGFTMWLLRKLSLPSFKIWWPYLWNISWIAKVIFKLTKYDDFILLQKVYIFTEI